MYLKESGELFTVPKSKVTTTSARFTEHLGDRPRRSRLHSLAADSLGYYVLLRRVIVLSSTGQQS